MAFAGDRRVTGRTGTRVTLYGAEMRAAVIGFAGFAAHIATGVHEGSSLEFGIFQFAAETMVNDVGFVVEILLLAGGTAPFDIVEVVDTGFVPLFDAVDVEHVVTIVT